VSKRWMSILLWALIALAAPLQAQEFLQYFGDDCFLLIQIEAHGLAAAVPDEQMSRIKSYSLEALGFDWTERIDYLVVGMNTSSLDGTPRGIYGIIKGDRVIATIRALMERGGTGNLVRTSISGLAANELPSDSEEKFYLAQIGETLYVFGSRDGLERFQAVQRGEIPNLMSNQIVAQAYNQTFQGSFFRLFGYIPEELRSMLSGEAPALQAVSNYALCAAASGDRINLEGMLSSEDPSSLEAIKMMVEQLSPRYVGLDPTGVLRELVDGMSVQVKGSRVVVRGGIAKSTFENLMRRVASGLF
jgi:hypothetical protein